eukprot:5319783-Amphidinium_carterae.1
MRDAFGRLFGGSWPRSTGDVHALARKPMQDAKRFFSDLSRFVGVSCPCRCKKAIQVTREDETEVTVQYATTTLSISLLDVC